MTLAKAVEVLQPQGGRCQWEIEFSRKMPRLSEKLQIWPALPRMIITLKIV